jgi:hypothetical protein
VHSATRPEISSLTHTLFLISHFSLIWHIRTYSICVGHLITKILIEMVQGHISFFNLPLFGDLCQHIKKAIKVQ